MKAIACFFSDSDVGMTFLTKVADILDEILDWFEAEQHSSPVAIFIFAPQSLTGKIHSAIPMLRIALSLAFRYKIEKTPVYFSSPAKIPGILNVQEVTYMKDSEQMTASVNLIGWKIKVHGKR